MRVEEREKHKHRQLILFGDVFTSFGSKTDPQTGQKSIVLCSGLSPIEQHSELVSDLSIIVTVASETVLNNNTQPQ